MESASFIGLYSVREFSCFPELQTVEFGGVCHVWKRAEGELLVLPVSRKNAPQGNFYILDGRDFEFLFQPYSAPATTGGFAAKRPVRADSPDILGIWYEQALASDPSPCETKPAPPVAESWGSMSRGTTAAISHDEPVLTPAWHPDELFEEGNGPAKPVFADAPIDSGRTQHPPLYAPPPLSPPSYGKPPLQGATRRAPMEPVEPADEDEEHPETRSTRLEQRMRNKFQTLLSQMTEMPDSALEDEVSRLLTLGSTFGWKQKFMFTEFGLALRRKQKIKLALASHLRALELAPNDEHVLFNVARSQYELGNMNKAKDYLNKALDVAPEFTVAKNFQRFLLGRA